MTTYRKVKDKIWAESTLPVVVALALLAFMAVSVADDYLGPTPKDIIESANEHVDSGKDAEEIKSAISKIWPTPIDSDQVPDTTLIDAIGSTDTPTESSSEYRPIALAKSDYTESQEYRYVEVKEGDSLYSIAMKDKAGHSYLDLYFMNKETIGSNMDLILPGMKIRIRNAYRKNKGASDRKQ